MLSLVRLSKPQISTPVPIQTIPQIFRICIDIHTEKNSEEDILVIMTNKDDNMKSQHLIPSTKGNAKGCVLIKAQKKPHFEILTSSRFNVSDRWIPFE